MRVFLSAAGIVGVFVIWKALQRKDKSLNQESSKSDHIVLTPSSSNQPLNVLKSWINEYELVSKSKITSKFACLSTIQCMDENKTDTMTPKPNSRMVSILDITPECTFMFGTILTSDKVKEMKMNNNVCLTFNYNETRTSIRINGIVRKCDDKISSKYWKSRGKSYKIWAMTTTQKNEINNINEFKERIDSKSREYENIIKTDIKLPINKWSVFEIEALQIEFWRYGSNNLHLRHKYIKNDDSNLNNSWKCVMLDS